MSLIMRASFLRLQGNKEHEKTLSEIVYTQGMLSYNKLQDRPREFVAATGGTLAEFEQVLPAFQAAYDQKYPPDRTLEGQARQRRAGAGAKGKLPRLADKFLCILVSQKTHPVQTMHGLHCNLSQSQTTYWPHR